MSKADKMFEELGLKKFVKPVYSDLIECYTNAGVLGLNVTFDTTYKHWYANGTISVKMQKAINEKMKELGWLDEV